MPNRELFQKIHEQISAHPDTHYQGSWETGCGTTRCVAGWAIHLTTGAPVFGSDGRVSAQTRALAAEYGTRDAGPGGWHAGYMVADLAQELLGLSQPEAGRLFLADDDYNAAKAVEAYAEGRDDVAREFLSY